MRTFHPSSYDYWRSRRLRPVSPLTGLVAGWKRYQIRIWTGIALRGYQGHAATRGR
jgi:hypothetical protein